MKIEIEYNGSLAKCTVDGKPYWRCDKLTKAQVTSAFHAIENEFVREYKEYLARCKNLK